MSRGFLAGVVLGGCLAFSTLMAAQSPAPSKPSSSRHGAKTSSHAKAQALDPGFLLDGLYRNSAFAFTCRVPFGWVDRTTVMRSPDNHSDDHAADPARQQTLLGVFEHPPEVTTSTINSAVVIAAESISAYPGLKEAAQYFCPLTEVVKAQGFKVVEEPYVYEVGSRQMVRGDFSKAFGTLTMYQSSLVMLSKGYAVSFTFIGSTPEEVDDLIANLSFGPAQSAK